MGAVVQPAGAARRGRRTGGGDTRAAILAAAREEFAARGYDGASVRGIARAAGVDPALVHHYFAGGKEQVFLAAMELPVDPARAVPALLSGPPEQLGERLVRFLLSVWGDPAARQPVLALLRAATTTEAGALLLRQFVTRMLLERVAHGLDLPDRELRVSAAASQLVGLALLRYVVKVEPLASISDDEVVALVGPGVQRYLTGTLIALR